MALQKTFSNSKLFITDSLYILGNSSFYEDKNKDIQITDKNWHHYWCDYGFYKLSNIWIKRINKYTDVKPKNNQYGVLDCGSEGDCLFHCIAHAFNEYYPDPKYSAQKIRKMAANCINDKNFNFIIESYKIQKECDEFEGLWAPGSVTIKEFKKVIRKMGNTFWGDHIIIQLLEDYLGLNIILFNNFSEGEYDYRDIKNKIKLYPTASELNSSRKTILLSYEDEIHFTLIGKFNARYMQTLFDWGDLPEEIIRIYNTDCVSNIRK